MFFPRLSGFVVQSTRGRRTSPAWRSSPRKLAAGGPESERPGELPPSRQDTVSSVSESTGRQGHGAGDVRRVLSLGASFALLGVEVSARLAVLARDGLLDSPEADQLVNGVGGAIDAADASLASRDVEGAQRFVEAAMDLLDV